MYKCLQEAYDNWGLNTLLASQPGLSMQPSSMSETVIAGELTFNAKQDDYAEISDGYELKIQVPNDFPRCIPTVTELQGRIPRSFHTQPDDGTLCLGSPGRLMLEVKSAPNLPTFVNRCVVPYLYGFSYKEKYGVLPQGELPHGREGVLEDYCTLFNVDNKKKCLRMIGLACMQKRAANKKPCFCGSGRRLGKCHNRKVNTLRELLGRKWLSEEYRSLQ